MSAQKTLMFNDGELEMRLKKRYEECRRYQGPLIANTLEEQF